MIQVAWMRCASTERCGIARMHFVPMMSFEAVRMRCALAKRCGAARSHCSSMMRRGASWKGCALMMGFGRVARCGFCYS